MATGTTSKAKLDTADTGMVTPLGSLLKPLNLKQKQTILKDTKKIEIFIFIFLLKNARLYNI